MSTASDARIVKGEFGLYEVGKQVAAAPAYRLYLCKQQQTGRQCLLQVAVEAKNNGELDRSAYALKELKRRADEVEAEYALVKPDPNKMLSYDLQFPELVDSFVLKEQGGRRVSILAFRGVEKVATMVPTSFITERYELRVDLRTSAWIFGKLLKIMAFAHNELISIGSVTSGNILLEQKDHYVLIWDWAQAQWHTDAIDLEKRRQEVVQAAQITIVLLGGDLVTGAIPNDGDESEDCFARYTDFLLRMSRGGESNAFRAHERFYEMINTFWHGYHPFTTKPLAR